MSEENKEKRKASEKKRLRNVAKRMENLKIISGEVEASSGDPFALELEAKLTNITGRRNRWGRKDKKDTPAEKRRRFRNGFTPPRLWKSGEQKGLAILDKALLFMSTFRDMGLGFRDLHILIMIAGDHGISIQQAADLSGVTYYAIRKSLRKMDEAGIIKTSGIERAGGQKPLVVVELTSRGAGILRALNRFDPDKIGDFDRLVAMGRPNIPADMRILQMKGVIEDARNIQQDI